VVLEPAVAAMHMARRQPPARSRASLRVREIDFRFAHGGAMSVKLSRMKTAA
jgi:hypothetical protein